MKTIDKRNYNVIIITFTISDSDIPDTSTKMKDVPEVDM